MLLDFTSPFDATVVELLRSHGASVVGKTNCDEFGMGSLNTYSAHGPVVNPFRAAGAKSPGRSVNVGQQVVALEVARLLWLLDSVTHTGGSIRLPASYCGVVGLKPSYGLVSRWGVVSYADSLDCVGVMARGVDTVKTVFNVSPHTMQKTQQQLIRVHGKRLLKFARSMGHGCPADHWPDYVLAFHSELNPSTLKPLRRVLEHLKSRGASLVPVSLPSTPYALSAYYVISSAEASSNMARYDGIEYGLYKAPPPGSDKTKTANVYAHSRSAGFGKEVQKRILLGTYALSADAFDNYFLQAQRVRNLIRADFDRVFAVPNVLTSSPQKPQTKACTSCSTHPQFALLRHFPQRKTTVVSSTRTCKTYSLSRRPLLAFLP
ncbi:amidase signature domain-containing protein [Fomitopsis serialis]|uniref:amidase signature domain-containing protein n=1 Tax=Fomitopsis serialis TaxID=139415 RepID=UPI0020078A77|nr:amidase signature domain-containing protein [Neoantrodia serialis]KAH9926917.1 amidase signature domain-containing protein [Neoantrodia serialis]